MHSVQAALEEDMVATPMLEARRMRQGTKMGAWLDVFPSTVNGKDLGDQDMHDFLFLLCVIDP